MSKASQKKDKAVILTAKLEDDSHIAVPYDSIDHIFYDRNSHSIEIVTQCCSILIVCNVGISFQTYKKLVKREISNLRAGIAPGPVISLIRMREFSELG